MTYSEFYCEQCVGWGWPGDTEESRDCLIAPPPYDSPVIGEAYQPIPPPTSRFHKCWFGFKETREEQERDEINSGTILTDDLLDLLEAEENCR